MRELIFGNSEGELALLADPVAIFFSYQFSVLGLVASMSDSREAGGEFDVFDGFGGGDCSEIGGNGMCGG